MTELDGYIRAGNRLRVIIRHAIAGGFVLVVDDDDSVCLFFETMIKNAGLGARHVDNVADAQTVLHDNADKIICVIVDLNLRGCDDGEDVIRDIERNYPKIPYIVCSGARKKTQRITNHFPRANVFHKGESIDGLLRALGISCEAV